ncbi:sorcin [Crocuta crocuta]
MSNKKGPSATQVEMTDMTENQTGDVHPNLRVWEDNEDPAKEIEAVRESQKSGDLEATSRKCVQQEGVMTMLSTSDVPNMIEGDNWIWQHDFSSLEFKHPKRGLGRDYTLEEKNDPGGNTAQKLGMEELCPPWHLRAVLIHPAPSPQNCTPFTAGRPRLTKNWIPGNDAFVFVVLQYGGAPGGPAFPGQTQDPLYGYFAAVAGQDGQIDADELQRCLTQSGIAGGYKPFNLETCRLMVSMLDRDMSGTMGFNEFKELWAVLNGWRQHFTSFDSDRSGTVDPQELQKALTTMGFRLSPQAVNSIAKRYSTNGKITFDDYIACCVKLRALTDSFRRRDTAQQGVVNFPYDDFIQCVMSV